MEIDIFPLPHSKEGVGRNFDKAFLGLIILIYVIAAYKITQQVIGTSKEDELLRVLLIIPVFIGLYALLVILLNIIKACIYAFFKTRRKEWNSKAEREEMDSYIADTSSYKQHREEERAKTGGFEEFRLEHR